MAELTRSRSHAVGDTAPTRTDFRDAMARFASSVAIVTTAGPAGRCGLTVSSVTPVSDEPPIILVCVNQHARTCGLIAQNGVFSVNLLNVGTERLADAFAGRFDLSVDERFAMADWDNAPSDTEAPVLPSAQVSFRCTVSESKAAGTHTVFFGSVLSVVLGELNETLLYHNRSYRQLSYAHELR